MKIRIKGNSIRLRLTKGEVDLLKETGIVEEQTHFPNKNTFIYSLEIHEKGTVIANFENKKITVLLPVEKAEIWINSEQVGIEKLLDLGDNNSLKILVEKDFNCLIKREGEEDTDAFPNPLNELKK